MYIESIELKNFRNYQDLQLDFDKGTIFFMEIMRRVKPIFWNLCIFVGQRNHIKEVKTKKSFVLERKNLIFE